MRVLTHGAFSLDYQLQAAANPAPSAVRRPPRPHLAMGTYVSDWTQPAKLGASIVPAAKHMFKMSSADFTCLCSLFFDNLATLLGVTGSAVGHIGYGLINAGWRNWIPDLYKLHIAIEWEKIYYEVRVAPAPRHPSPGGGWLAPFQIARGNRARA